MTNSFQDTADVIDLSDEEHRRTQPQHKLVFTLEFDHTKENDCKIGVNGEAQYNEIVTAINTIALELLQIRDALERR